MFTPPFVQPYAQPRPGPFYNSTFQFQNNTSLSQNNVEPPVMDLQYNSQLLQDKWVCETLNYMKNGTYVDLGSAEPIKGNNTYVLESRLGWRGISVDIRSEDVHSPSWTEVGRDMSMVYAADAVMLDYKKLFQEHNMPNVIDYLSMDLEPPLLTLEALYKIPFDDYKFKCITYETDAYREFDTVKPSRKFLESKGYKLVAEINNQDDYWVHPDFFEIK